MPLHIKKIWQFIRKAATGFTWKRSRLSVAASRTVKLYQNIHDLPLFKFKDCVVEQNLHVLVIEGTPTEDQLKEAWEQIASEYAAAVGDAEYKLYFNTYRELLQMAVDLSNAELLIDTLRKAFYQPLLDELNKLLGSSVKLDGLQKEAYYKQLDVLYKRSRGIKIKLDLKNMQFKAMEQKFGERGSGKPTREYFDSMLITLSDHAGYQLTDSISVFEYCERIKRYTKYVEQMQKKLQWQK